MKTVLTSLRFLPPLLLALLTGCSPLAVLNAFVPSSTHTLTADIAYGPSPRHKLDIYTPTQIAPAGGYPMVVFFYGGSWNRGEKADYKFVGEALASRGILTLVADYRLYPEIRYPKRVFVMGHSAGAYNASMLALDGRWLKAAAHAPSELAGFIGLAGPYDFLPMTNPEAQPVFFHPNYPAGSQPIDYASAAAPKTFLGAAKEDSLVNPQRNTVSLHDRLKAAGVPVTLRLYDRVNHVTLAAALGAPMRWLAPVLDDVALFINPKGNE
jgi:acetyl esterase/lipase